MEKSNIQIYLKRRWLLDRRILILREMERHRKFKDEFRLNGNKLWALDQEAGKHVVT